VEDISMTRLKSLKGFTLIELIVVVIIIGVLAAIAAVAYNQFVGNARSTATLASAKQVEKILAAQSAQDDVTPTASIAAVGANVQGATATVSGNNVKVVAGTRSACLQYAPNAPAGANASTIVLGTDTNVAC
jgi:type IV pilus assembly protein PilA